MCALAHATLLTRQAPKGYAYSMRCSADSPLSDTSACQKASLENRTHTAIYDGTAAFRLSHRGDAGGSSHTDGTPDQPCSEKPSACHFCHPMCMFSVHRVSISHTTRRILCTATVCTCLIHSPSHNQFTCDTTKSCQTAVQKAVKKLSV